MSENNSTPNGWPAGVFAQSHPAGHFYIYGDEMLEHALRLIEQGFRILPVEPRGKKAIGKNWWNRATSDPKKAKRIWGAHPDYNIGIACGNGLLVLDMDGPDGKKSIQALEHLHGELPETAMQITGSNVGYHPQSHYRHEVVMRVPAVSLFRPTVVRRGQRSKTRIWHMAWRDESGKRHSATTGTANKATAKLVANEKQRSFAIPLPPADPAEKHRDMTWIEFCRLAAGWLGATPLALHGRRRRR